jgi:hypothetical protein
MMNLQPFCHPNRAYGSLSTPFSRGEHTYATDGHLIVRVPRLADVFERDNTPRVDHLGWNHAELEDWANPPEIDQATLKLCSVCKGSGKTNICPECDGDGEVIAESHMREYEVVCKTCGGDGKIAGGEDVCDHCLGNGKDIDNPVPWRGGHVSGQLLARLSTLPGLQLSRYGEPTEVIRFKFDGGDGLVMPMRA